MDRLSDALQDTIMRAALVAQSAGHTEVGTAHLLYGMLAAEPELAPDLNLHQLKKVLPASSTGEFRFASRLTRVLESAQRETAHLVEPNEKHFLQALLEPGRALALLAHHLGRNPEEWLHRVGPAVDAQGLEQSPDRNEWRMLLSWLDNPRSQVRNWLNPEELATALEWTARVAGPFPATSDTGWLARAKFYAARDAGHQPLSRRLLFHALTQQREVALLQWRLGGTWLRPVAHHSFWHGPGLAVACHYGHAEVTPLHVLADCLGEPVLQASMNALRQAVRKVLEGETRDSPAPVAAALKRTVLACRRWNVEPARIHLAYVLLRDFASGGIAEALEWSGREAGAWLKRLRRPMLGRLRPGRWLVDGVALGDLLAEQGPLRAQDDRWVRANGTQLWADRSGQVRQVFGVSMKSQDVECFGPETRAHTAEALVGLGRLERWLGYGEAEIRVRCEAGCVTQVGLRRTDGSRSD